MTGGPEPSPVSSSSPARVSRSQWFFAQACATRAPDSAQTPQSPVAGAKSRVAFNLLQRSEQEEDMWQTWCRGMLSRSVVSPSHAKQSETFVSATVRVRHSYKWLSFRRFWHNRQSEGGGRTPISEAASMVPGTCSGVIISKADAELLREGERWTICLLNFRLHLEKTTIAGSWIAVPNVERRSPQSGPK